MFVLLLNWYDLEWINSYGHSTHVNFARIKDCWGMLSFCLGLPDVWYWTPQLSILASYMLRWKWKQKCIYKWGIFLIKIIFWLCESFWGCISIFLNPFQLGERTNSCSKLPRNLLPVVPSVEEGICLCCIFHLCPWSDYFDEPSWLCRFKPNSYQGELLILIK